MVQYDRVHHIYWQDGSHIAWHTSTGENTEVLFLRSETFGNGGLLYRAMVKQIILLREVPYHSVFAYRRTDNELAERFYAKFGWQQVDLGPSIYREGGTTLMWITWDDLLKRLRIEERKQ